MTDEIYTTGQVAKMVGVAPRTVCKWFDSGRLGGFIIPGSRSRRVSGKSLVKFLKEHNVPIPSELAQAVPEAPQTPPELHTVDGLILRLETIRKRHGGSMVVLTNDGFGVPQRVCETKVYNTGTGGVVVSLG